MNSELDKIPEQIRIQTNSFLHVKVGSDDRPATVTDVADIQNQFDEALKEKFPDALVITTHHNVNIDIVMPI